MDARGQQFTESRLRLECHDAALPVLCRTRIKPNRVRADVNVTNAQPFDFAHPPAIGGTNFVHRPQPQPDHRTLSGQGVAL